MEKRKSISECIADLNLNDEQKTLINKYSRLRTAKKYEKEALRIFGDPELADMWFYDGFHDTGYFGGGKCSRGHTLRYEHYAKHKFTEQVIVFGIKCVTDFFNLTKQQLKLIQQGVMETNEEVYQILNKLEKYGSFESYNKDNEITERLALITNQPEHIDEINQFLEAKLPLPNNFEKEISRIYNQEYSDREYTKYLKDNPDIRESVIKAQMINDDSSFKTKHPLVWERINSLVDYLKKNKKISSGQTSLFKKLVNVDYDLVDTMIAELRMVNASLFLKSSKFNEIEIMKSMVDQYEQWGLSEAQIKLITKIHTRLQNRIDEAKMEAALDKAE